MSAAISESTDAKPGGIPDAKTLACMNILYDVAALLAGAEARIDAMTPGDDELHATLRLVQMARGKVSALADGCWP